MSGDSYERSRHSQALPYVPSIWSNAAALAVAKLVRVKMQRHLIQRHLRVHQTVRQGLRAVHAVHLTHQTGAA